MAITGSEPGSDVRLIFTSPPSKMQPATASAAQVVQIRVGSRPLPITFAGPMAIEICRLTEFAPYGTGNLEVRVHAAGLPASVVACQEMQPLLAHIEAAFDAVKDQHGNLLGHDQGSYRPWFDLPSIQSQTHYLELSNLLRRSETIHVTGHVGIPVPVQVETLQLDELSDGVKGEAGGLRLKLDASPAALDTTRNDSYVLPVTLTCVLEDIQKHMQQIVAFDENERALQVTGHNFLGVTLNGKQPDELHGSLWLDGKPARLLCKVVVQMQTLDYPFELVAPLKSSPEQPEQRTELEFPGAAPVSIDVLELTRSEPFSKVKVRWKNHSNKDVKGVGYTMNYLDASGQKLKDHGGRFSGGASTDGGPAVGIAKASSRDSEETAFFVPTNAARVEIAVGDVTFLDGSIWVPPAP